MNSLIDAIENIRQRTRGAVFQIMNESSLPAYLMEGIVEGVLAEVRNRKIAEMNAEHRNTIKEMQEEAAKKEKERRNRRGTRKNNKTS